MNKKINVERNELVGIIFVGHLCLILLLVLFIINFVYCIRFLFDNNYLMAFLNFIGCYCALEPSLDILLRINRLERRICEAELIEKNENIE